jgi:hypothetical protein
VLLFFLLIGFVFWITSLHDRPDFEARTVRLPQGSGPPSPRLRRGHAGAHGAEADEVSPELAVGTASERRRT